MAGYHDVYEVGPVRMADRPHAVADRFPGGNSPQGSPYAPLELCGSHDHGKPLDRLHVPGEIHS